MPYLALDDLKQGIAFNRGMKEWQLTRYLKASRYPAYYWCRDGDYSEDSDDPDWETVAIAVVR